MLPDFDYITGTHGDQNITGHAVFQKVVFDGIKGGLSLIHILMNQYTPLEQTGRLERFPELQRKVTRREYERLLDYAIDLGLENGFIQEGKTAEESFIPAFDYEGL